MRNVSDKSCGGNQITHFVFNNFFSKKCVVYEIMWKNIVEQGATEDNMAHVQCILAPKATNTHSQYVKVLPFHCNSGCKKAPQCYVINILPVLLNYISQGYQT
jgi:hypothetical protein